MKKIGFIDYYISEWHANNYPEWIKAASEKMGEDFAVAYAWAELDISPEDGVSTDEWCEKYGAEKCGSIAELCEKSDYILILSPSNPEKHLAYAKEAFKCGKNTYVDKTFAPDFDTAKEIFDTAEKYGTRFFSSSALRFADELSKLSPSDTLKISGGGRSIEEYIIHQIEMAVKVQGVGAGTVSLKKRCGVAKIEISYPDGRLSTLSYKDSSSFSVNSKPIKSQFFVNLISDILRFYLTGEVSFDTAQTLEVIKIRDAVIALSKRAARSVFDKYKDKF